MKRILNAGAPLYRNVLSLTIACFLSRKLVIKV